MPNLKMPDGAVVAFPDDMPKEQIKSLIASKYPDAFQPQGNEFTRAVPRGLMTTTALVTEGVPAVVEGLINDAAEFIGKDAPLDTYDNLKRYQDQVTKAYEKYPTRVPTFKDIHNMGDAGAFAASALGEQIPQLGLSLFTGGTTGLAAKQAVKTLAKRQGMALTEAQATKALAKGAVLGTVASSASQNVPETYFNLLAEGKDAATTSVIVGGLKTSLDTIPQLDILRKVLGPSASDIVSDTLLKRVGKEAVKAGVKEGATESAQEGLDILAESFVADNKDVFSDENVVRMIDAGLKGAIGGSIMGAGAAPFMKGVSESEYENLSPEEKAKIDAQFSEEVIGEAPQQENLNDLDPSIVVPTFVPDEVAQAVDTMGIEKESLTTIDPVDLETIAKTLNETTEAVPDLTPDLAKRKKKVKTKERTDQEFIPGDGEIVEGATVNSPTSRTIRNPARKVKVADTNKLQQKVNKPQKAQPTPIKTTPKLPKVLAGAKPRFMNQTVEFESDVDKALYIVGQKTKSKKDAEYVDWLLTNTNIPEAEIRTAHTKIKEAIRKQSLAEPAKDVLSVPKVIDLPEAILQRAEINLPSYGNLEDDYFVPIKLAENLKGVRLTPNAELKYKDVVNQMQRIVTSVTGPQVRVKAFDKLLTLDTEPTLGGYILNVVNLAINDRTLTSLDETAYHEAWHFLERIKAFDDNELAILNRNTPLLREYMNQDGWLRTQDFDVYLATPEGMEELRANAFGKAAIELRKGLGDASVPGVFKRYFRKAKNIIERLGNALRGLGFKSADDIFASTFEGSKVSDILDDINYTTRISRLQRVADAYQDVLNEERKQVPYTEILQEARLSQNEKTQTSKKTIGLYTRYLRSWADSASEHPFLAQAYNSVSRRVQNGHRLLDNFVGKLGDYQSQPKAVREKLHDIADYLVQTGQQVKFDEQDRLYFNRGDKVVRLSDPALSKHFRQMQAGYVEVIDSYDDLLRVEAFKEFEKELVYPDFTIEDVDAAVTFLDPKTQQSKIEKLMRLSEDLKSIQSMRGTTFVPHMRFGSFGIVVNNKETKEQEAFFTIESGLFNKLYNKTQLEKVVKDLQKYSDNTKYEIVGGKGRIKGEITLDKVVPFKLTHNELKNKVDTRFLNIELLSSLLANNTLDEESYATLKEDIYNDILSKGFRKRFDRSRGIEGYSRDWDRVQHAYLSGAAHFISGLAQQPELAVLESEATKLLDNKLRDKVLSYLKYNNSPSEDFMVLRQFNFMWAMGGNISSALLQFMTLSTSTLSSMSKYNPNLFSNQKRIGKWLSVGTSFFGESLKTMQTHNGVLYAHFNDPALLDKMVKSGKITASHAKFIEHATSHMRGALTEEYSGFKPFETQSLTGTVRGKMSTVANVLGAPISAAEQLTRFATALAHYDLFLTDKPALERARKVLAKDARFQAQLQNDPTLDFATHAALFAIDEAHAVFGKLGRAEIMRGLGGSLFFPFMTYPQQTLEFIMRTFGQGNDGKRAVLVMLSALFLFSGLIGLPGFELLKELMEELEKQITGSEEDFDLLIREKIYEQTGDMKFSKFVTQGVGRAYFGLDIAKRIGVPLWPQQFVLNVLGLQGQSSSASLGVAGSLLDGMATAWNEYNNESSAVTVASALMPTAPANLLKAYQFTQTGVATKKGVMLVPPDEVKASTVFGKALGVTTDQIATKREEQFAKILYERKDVVAIERFRTRGKKIFAELLKAREDKDFDRVKELQSDYQEVLNEYRDYAKRNKIIPDLGSFNTSVIKGARQRTEGKVNLKDVRKNAREPFKHTQEVLGLNE